MTRAATVLRSRAVQRRVLITGVSGYAGRHIALALAGRGWRVAGTYLAHGEVVRGLAGVEVHRVDLTSPLDTAALLMELAPQVVIHAAAMTDVNACEQAPAAAFDAIVRTTYVLRACCAPRGQQGVGVRLVYLSTDLVYPGTKGNYGPHAPRRPLSVYGRLKAEAEDVVGEQELVRASLLYGPPSERKAGAVGWMVGELRAGRAIELFEDEIRSPLHVGDLALGLAALLDLPAQPGRQLNLGGPDRLSRLDMGRIVAQAFGLDERLLVPGRLARSSAVAARPRDVSLDGSGSWAALGMRPRSFDRGARELAASWPG